MHELLPAEHGVRVHSKHVVSVIELLPAEHGVRVHSEHVVSVIELLPAEHGVRVSSEHVGIHDEPRLVHNQRDPTVLVRIRTVRRLTLLVFRDCKNNHNF